EEDVDDDEDDMESDSEGEEESDGEPDEEEIKERRRRNKSTTKGVKRGRGARQTSAAPRKPAAKKVKTVSGEAITAERKKAVPKVRAARKPKSTTNGNVTAVPSMVNNLYDAVFAGNTDDHDEAATGWIKKYQENSVDGMKEMINFILKCCGCDNEVTNYDIEDQESASTTLAEIQDAFSTQQTADYPLTSKSPAFRKFRQNLSGFVNSLVAAVVSEDLITHDRELLENMLVWISAMSSSTLRQFRHTATVFALDMVSHFSASSRDLRKLAGNANRQKDAEEKKASPNEGRIADLVKSVEERQEKYEAIEVLLKDIFDTVFVHRYRDIDPKIRIDCVQELSNWITILPEKFFDGQYIRYLGWVLSDTVAATRLEVVKSLTKLFRHKDQVAGLRTFTERFKARLVEMGTSDVDTSVRAATIELLDIMREVGFLGSEEVETIGRLLFDPEQKVRRAVAPFFVENINDLYETQLEEIGGKEAVEEVLGGGEDAEEYEGPTLAWIKLKCLVKVLASYDQADATNDDGPSQSLLAETTSGLVMKVDEIASRLWFAGAVLWDELEEVRDWEGMARYLLYDHSASRTEGEDDSEDLEKQVKKAVALDTKEDVILLQMLHASVTGCIWKEPPTDKKNSQPVSHIFEIEKFQELVSRSLTPLIPQLLRKFGPVPDAASSVLRLVKLMKLTVFQDLRLGNAYSTLLDDINRQFLTHADEVVLRQASQALGHAKTFLDLREVTESKLTQLKEETISNLVAIVGSKDAATFKFSDSSLTGLINTVRRLEYLSGISDCTETLETPPTASKNSKTKAKAPALIPINVLLSLLERGTSKDELEEELTLRLLRSLDYYFMWKIVSLNKSLDFRQPPDDAEIDALQDTKQQVIRQITTILTSRSSIDAVKLSAASTLLDLTTLFVAAKDQRLVSVSSSLDSQTQSQLMAVFDHLEKSFGKAIGQKMEPDEHAAPEDDDDEDEEETGEETKVMAEQKLCEFTSKIILAVLGKLVEQKTWRKRLGRNQARLGPNYKEVVNHLDRASVGRPGMRRGAQQKPTAQLGYQKKDAKSAEKVIDSEDEQENGEGEEVDDQGDAETGVEEEAEVEK
ncbi:STAG domain-containing protein, partial [Pyronema domesticum]